MTELFFPVFAEVGPVDRLIALLVYGAGFMAIPFIFKSLTGLLGQITGQINDRSKGLIDSPRKFLQDKAKAQKKDIRARRSLRLATANLNRSGKKEDLKEQKKKLKGGQISRDQYKGYRKNTRSGTFRRNAGFAGSAARDTFVRPLGSYRKEAKSDKREKLIGDAYEVAEKSYKSLDSNELVAIASDSSGRYNVAQTQAALNALGNRRDVGNFSKVATEILSSNNIAAQKALERYSNTDSFEHFNEIAPQLINPKLDKVTGNLDFSAVYNASLKQSADFHENTWNDALQNVQDKAQVDLTEARAELQGMKNNLNTIMGGGGQPGIPIMQGQMTQKRRQAVQNIQNTNI